ncbi:MAG: hypothetical protein IRZ29_09715, partial [Thermoflavifilum sp.]|nr:hypothetical protein [Thermoflavifilum sp.]
MHDPIYHEADRLEILSGKLPATYSSFVKPYQASALMPYVQQVDSQTTMLSAVDRAMIRQWYTSYPEWLKDSTLADTSRHPIAKHFYTSPAYLFQYHSPDF